METLKQVTTRSNKQGITTRKFKTKAIHSKCYIFNQLNYNLKENTKK